MEPVDTAMNLYRSGALVFFVIIMIPLGMSFYYSLTEWNGISADVKWVLLLIALLFLVPFYFVIVNSLKSFAEILTNASDLPHTFFFGNYSRVWTIMNFPKAFLNSLMITVFSNVGLVIISSLSAYRMVRFPSRFNQILFAVFIAAMVIPFQSIMIPLVRVADKAGLMNSIPGLVMTITVIILNSLWIWNDFLLPSLILNSPELRTIPLSTFSFFGQYTKQWDLALAASLRGYSDPYFLPGTAKAHH
jgi:raffinose/stachyose/melibiose transport system permease protein